MCTKIATALVGPMHAVFTHCLWPFMIMRASTRLCAAGWQLQGTTLVLYLWMIMERSLPPSDIQRLAPQVCMT
eukprot:COSAG01_NODE_134_length_24525_cov_434.185172_8_plen_73_part_00